MISALSDAHRIILHKSAITDEVIAARGYRSINETGELEKLGFARFQCRVPGLVLPLHTTDGGNSLYIYRPDNPRVVEQKQKGKLRDGTYPNRVIKYEIPKGVGTRIDCPPTCQPMLANPTVPLWITEGQKKADALASIGKCAIAVLGVWNWKTKNDFGGNTVSADFDYIALNDRDVRIVFDSDVMTKSGVRQALDRLTVHLQRKGAHVGSVYLPNGKDGTKLGVDDYLAEGHTSDELESLVEAPRPSTSAAAPIIELLDAAPPAMSRPLAFLKGQGYAAAWVNVQITVTESVNRQGQIIKHEPPSIQQEQRLIVVRDDGVVFGDGGEHPLDELGFKVHLSEQPPADRLWSVPGIKSYRAGNRPAPADAFRRVVENIDRFIDFDRSIADQLIMCEMMACYTLSTWFLDAFNVIGFLWPNGDRGCGKTHLISIICEQAYLGQVVLSGGSFATLRDLADYGATLGFDDAEGLSDPKRSDPDKRNLLLAGNRRGNTVPVKEPVGDGKWKTRYVNTFCPRLFSATQLPDPILESRTIVVPLIRTPDRQRANADPMDYPTWAHDRRKLIDDLWALAVAHIHELPAHEAKVNQHAELVGRALEPWKGLLAVASWMDEHGVAGLWDRMAKLSVAYQTERPNLTVGDLTALVIQSLTACVESALATNPSERSFTFPTKVLTEAAIKLVEDGELDFDVEKISSRRIGRVLGKMRFKNDRTGKSRQWAVSLTDLMRWCNSYGIPVPDNVTNAINVTNVTDQLSGDVNDVSDINDIKFGREVFEI